MTAIVYVAGSSDELRRARIAMEIIRAEGWTVSLDWVSIIRDNGGIANPADASRTQRAEWARESLLAIRRADAVWMLAPEEGHARGAFAELGYAVARDTPIVVSGPKHACSIFTALARVEAPTDAHGLAILREWLPR